MRNIKKIVIKFAPLHTKRGRILKRSAASIGLAKPMHFNNEYKNWIDNVEPHLFLPIIKSPNKETPLFSIVIPFYNTPDKYLIPLLESVRNQSFGDWELIVADASTEELFSKNIKAQSTLDNRLKYIRINKNEGISGNTNLALMHVSGDYTVFADHDDVLSPHALNEVAAKVLVDPNIDIIYSDEDKLSDNGKWRHSPYFKPDWSPHLFLYTNYTNHLSAIKTKLVKEVGGLRPEFDGSQDYDLLLRVHTINKKPLKVCHISKILYHWREAAGSTAVDYNSKSYAFEAGNKALNEFIERKCLNGKVHSIKETPGFYMEDFKPSLTNQVYVMVNVSKYSYENIAMINELREYTKTELNVMYLETEQFNLISALDNTDGKVVVEFNTCAYPQSADWLDRLVGVIELDDVAAVSPKIVSSDGCKVVDMGIVYGPDGEKISLYKDLSFNDLTMSGGALWVRDVDELTQSVIVYRLNQGKLKKHGQHYVIWSHVVFNKFNKYGIPSHFNQNLQVLNDGRITVND